LIRGEGIPSGRPLLKYEQLAPASDVQNRLKVLSASGERGVPLGNVEAPEKVLLTLE